MPKKKGPPKSKWEHKKKGTKKTHEVEVDGKKWKIDHGFVEELFGCPYLRTHEVKGDTIVIRTATKHVTNLHASAWVMLAVRDISLALAQEISATKDFEDIQGIMDALMRQGVADLQVAVQ